MTNIFESSGKNIPILLLWGHYSKKVKITIKDNNPAHEEFFNSLISGLKKKNQCWDRTNPVFNSFVARLRSANTHLFDERSSDGHD